MFYDELFISSQCACCQQDINGFGIECAECAINNPSASTSNSSSTSTSPIVRVRLCLGCFQLGAEVGPHKADHKYKFYDASGNLIIFPNETDAIQWTARELIRLLDAIEQYGFGNWHDISKHVESKTADQCKDEYVRRFVKGSIGKSSWVDSSDCLDKYSKVVVVERPKDHTIPDEGPLSPSLTQKLQQLDIVEDEASQLGYMPNRDDYEKEFDNDAEKLVCNLDFLPDDEEMDVALKLSLVDMYCKRLRERVRRKRVIRDYQLVSQFFKKERATMKESRAKRRFHEHEKELTEKLKPFAQFHTAAEHEHFISNLVREKELIFRLEELYKYRKNGITNQEDCLEYERLKNRKRKPDLSAVEEGGDSSLKEEMTTTTKIQTQVQMPHQNCKTSQSDLQGNVGSDENSASLAKSLIPQQSSCGATSLNSAESKSEELLSHLIAPVPKKGLLTIAEGGNQKYSPLTVQPQDEQKGSEDLFTANLQDLPSFDLLSYSEHNLCLRLNILPSDYLKYKLAFNLDPTVSTPPSNINQDDWIAIRNFLRDREFIKVNDILGSPSQPEI